MKRKWKRSTNLFIPIASVPHTSVFSEQNTSRTVPMRALKTSCTDNVN